MKLYNRPQYTHTLKSFETNSADRGSTVQTTPETEPQLLPKPQNM